MVPRKRGRPRKAAPTLQPCTTIAQYMPAEPEYVMVPKCFTRRERQLATSKCRKNLVDHPEGFLAVHPEPLLAAPSVVKGPVARSLNPT